MTLARTSGAPGSVPTRNPHVRSLLAVGFPVAEIDGPRSFLHQFGIAVTHGPTGRAAILTAFQTRFDAIALDLENCDEYVPGLISEFRAQENDTHRALIVA